MFDLLLLNHGGSGESGDLSLSKWSEKSHWQSAHWESTRNVPRCRTYFGSELRRPELPRRNGLGEANSNGFVDPVAVVPKLGSQTKQIKPGNHPLQAENVPKTMDPK